MVLQNSVLFGSVNAHRHHYELAAKAIAEANRDWLAGLITRQVSLNRWAEEPPMSASPRSSAIDPADKLTEVRSREPRIFAPTSRISPWH
jgi:hypothetical protein